MNLMRTFLIPALIQLFSNVKALEIDSSFLDFAKDVRCMAPFLSLNTIGYLQCQKMCVRYSDCEVLRYSKSLLECRLYFSNNCRDHSGDSDPHIYLRRNQTHKSIGRYCLQRCPSGNACVVSNNISTCFPDSVAARYLNINAIFVEIDGVYFGMYTVLQISRDASLFCESLSGRLAVLDTQKKLQIISSETKRVHEFAHWLIGAFRVADAEWQWSNGKPAYPDVINDVDFDCVMIYRAFLDDCSCSLKGYFVCEML
ncbi:uncharacterized protein LOC117340887 [Pecten maximus]|uniref:uncharacterized protein LOC117340887 n=1 Tax=Pecten maximus TaxID=6579 RepID=UPI00145818DD|nr:uncharacterized protein LOC117340887 [Pecten maximus]